MPNWDWEMIQKFAPIAAIMIVAYYWGPLSAWVKSKVSNVTALVPSAPPSLQDATVNASALIAYFKAIGCKEGEKAARAAGACIFHESHAGEA